MPKFSLSTAMAAPARWQQRVEAARIKTQEEEARQKAQARAVRSNEDVEKARLIAAQLEEEVTLEARAEAALSPTSDAEFEIRLPTEEELLRLQQPPPCVLLAEPHPDVHKWNDDFINRRRDRYELCETSDKVQFWKSRCSHIISSNADFA